MVLAVAGLTAHPPGHPSKSHETDLDQHIYATK